MRFWEQLFFISLIGLIVLFPLAATQLSFLTDDLFFAVFIILAAFLWLTVLLCRRRRHWRDLVLGGVAIFLANIILGIAIKATSPELVLWFFNAVLAVCSFGYLLAKHLFGRIEKHFFHDWKMIIVRGVFGNLVMLLFANFIFEFPLSLTNVLAVFVYLAIARKV